MKLSAATGRTLLMIALFLLPTAAGATEDSNPRDRMTEGNQAYQAQDWAAAAQAYQSVADSGMVHETVYYNLGCARARQGQLGQALLAFRRAIHLDPRHQDARANLEWLRSRLADAPAPRNTLVDLIARGAALVPLRGGLLVALALEWLAAGWIGWSLLKQRRRRLLWIGVVAGCLAAAIALAPATRLLLRAVDDGGVIILDRAQAHSGPGETNPVLFTVHEGYEVSLGSSREGWTRISTSDGLAGWIPDQALRPVNPAALPVTTN